tara:strand:- start:3144 stop:3965 length:822 start_codon:yes stop_codon:yes gene_type:complete
MVKTNIRDKNFGGEPSSCHKGTNKFVEWDFGDNSVSKSCFITDLCLQDVYKASGVKRKVAWILEPRAIHPHVYEWIEKNNKLFDYVLTFDSYLIAKGENYLYYPHGMCWIEKHLDCKKENKVSIIASGKDYAEGHKLRHSVIKELKDELDVFGYGYNPVDDKAEALSPHMYSVTIENCQQPGYWTEKIVDCFATKTIPIYWGAPEVGDYFDPQGILHFDTVEELKIILSDLKTTGVEVYERKKKAIERNFKLVEEYRIPEDWIFVNYPFLYDN